MPLSPIKANLLALAALYVTATTQPAVAQDRSYDIMVEEGGKPLKRSRKGAEPNGGEVKKSPKRQARPRGSSGVPSTGLPRTEAITVPSAPGVYRQPPINSYSDWVIGCNHSFPLSAGIGNNPTDRNAYVRQCAN